MTDENEKVEETTPEVKEKNLTSECHCEASSQHSDARKTRDDPGFAGCGNPFSLPARRRTY